MIIMKSSLVKGVFDVFPFAYKGDNPWQSVEYWVYLEKVIRKICQLNGFFEIRTPNFEYSKLFNSLGEYSDVVSKEMYTFLDKKGRSLTLRPEGTAPVIRAFVQHKLYEKSKNSKLFYILPMFRYERQQNGRYRQHHQFGAEVIGEKNPYKDAELILMLHQLYRSLNIEHVYFELNCLGDLETRENYVKKLKQFFQSHFSELSSLSQDRLCHNPLRILDSKEKEDKEIIKEAPSIFPFLKEEALEYFEKVLKILKSNNVICFKNDHLVRGLDYYTDLVFEVNVKKNSQTSLALGGGGRYDGLVSHLGGPKLSACGFGTGLERIIQCIIQQNKEPQITHPICLRFLPLGVTAQEKSLMLKQSLVQENIPVEVDWSGKGLKFMLSEASKDNIPFVCILGDEELKTGQLTIKNMREHEIIKCSEEELKKRLVVYEI